MSRERDEWTADEEEAWDELRRARAHERGSADVSAMMITPVILCHARGWCTLGARGGRA